MSAEQLDLFVEGEPELADQAARDEARDRIDTSFVVSAGAGAGKTETLIRRLEHVLASGCDPTRVVAITFTERAARDLVAKLRTKLPATLTHAIEQMSVGTIHAFCLGILRRHPLEAGLPPVFATQDELLAGTDAAERALRIHTAFFQHVAELDEASVRQAVDVLVAENGMIHLDALIGLVDQQWDRFEEIHFGVPGPWHEPCRAALLRVRELAADTDVPATLRAKLGDMVPAIDEFLTADTMVDALRAVPSAKGLGNNGGTAAKPVRDEVKALVELVPRLVHDNALRHVLHVLVPLVLAEAHTRYQSGSLSFDDILVLTRRLLAQRPEVCTRLRTEIGHLCVDEFQDTDVVQYDIVQALTALHVEADAAPVLFAVGDPKQSIYGFREAEVALFERLHQLPHLTPLQLSTNFRSRPGVLRWINELFRAWFDADAALGQVPFAPLDHFVADSPVTVSVVGGRLEASAERAAQAQATDIAKVVAAAHGSWICRTEHGERPAEFTDIAVLVRTRADLTHLEPALRRAGIPYVIEGGALLYDTREVRDLLRVLTAVNDTASPIKVVTALRTSVLAISDTELVAHRSAGGGWSLYGPAERPGHPAVLQAFTMLRGWSDARHHAPVPELLATIARRTWSHAASVVDDAPTTTWRRLRLVLDEARWWFEQTGGSLGEYLRWIALRIENDDRSNVTTDETDEDAVHILTVHAAKGLEFPIVVAAGLGRQRPGGDHVRAAFGVDGGARTVELKMGKLSTAGFTSGDERNLSRLEAARLAYVACTRAKDHLVVCLHHGNRGGACTAAEMAPHLPEGVDLVDLPAAPVVPRPPVTALDDHVDRPAVRATEWRVRSSWSATQLRHLDDDAATATATPAPVPDDAVRDEALPDEAVPVPVDAEPGDAVPGETLAVGAADPGESVHSKPPRSFAALPDQIGRYGTRVGRAVHGVVQVLDLDEPQADLVRLVGQQCRAEEVPDRFEPYVQRLVESIVRSEVFGRMAAASRSTTVRREMYVGAEVDGEGVYGIIDAVWMEDGRFVVVDFKTDHVLEDTATLASRYRPQLAAYAAALRAATGRDVGETVLCVALPDGAPAATITVSGT